MSSKVKVKISESRSGRNNLFLYLKTFSKVPLKNKVYSFTCSDRYFVLLLGGGGGRVGGGGVKYYTNNNAKATSCLILGNFIVINKIPEFPRFFKQLRILAYFIFVIFCMDRLFCRSAIDLFYRLPTSNTH